MFNEGWSGPAALLATLGPGIVVAVFIDATVVAFERGHRLNARRALGARRGG